MDSDSKSLLLEVFLEAAKTDDLRARAAYLDQACGDNTELRRRVERLLAAEAQAGGPPPEEPFSPLARGDPALGSSIGRYKLLQQIGEGGCGVVFMAEQDEPVRRRVALKVIKLGMDTKQVVARFEAERQALAMMGHPNIAQVFDAGATDLGRPFFVMELVRGIKITEFCDKNRLSTRQRLDLFIQVCHAVQHAHQKGIIHRDLKPSNILVTELDGKSLPKIIDFGIAKAVEGRLTDQTLFTAFEQFIGTPAYMSPEQAALNAADVDTCSDIYSLGVLLYELLTGRTPFDTKSLLASGLDAMRKTIQEEEPPRPSTRLHTLNGEELTTTAHCRGAEVPKLVHLIRGDLDWIVMKCLEKERGRRYETANGLAMDIERHLTNEPIVARPPSRLYEFQKTVRRHQLGFIATAAVILVLASGLVGVLWQWRRAVAAQQQTRQERDRAELLAAEAAAEKGQSKLEAGDSWGLFDLADAYGLAKHDSAFQEAVGHLWSTWHAEWEQRMIAVLRRPGIPSPDRLQTLTLSDWPTYNTSREVNIIDTLTGARIAGPWIHESNAKGGAFSPDGRTLAIVTEKGVIHLWDRTSGEAHRSPCETGISNLNCVSFSTDGRFLVAYAREIEGPGSKAAALLRLDEPGGQAHILEGHHYPIGDARFSPDGELLAVLCEPDLQLWQTSDFQPAGSPIVGSNSGLLEFSPDGTLLAFNRVGSGGIGLLNPRTRQVVQSLSTGSHSLTTAAFSNDGRVLAASGGDLNISLWKTTDSSTEPYATRRIGRNLYGHLSFSHDDSLLAVGDSAGTIHVLSTSDGHTVQTLHAFPWARPNFLTNGVLAASGGNAAFWGLSASPLPWNALPDDALANSLAFDRSGTVLAVGGEDELRLWNMQVSPRRERIIAMPGRILALTFSEAEDQFVAFSDDGSLIKVEPRTGITNLIRHIDRGRELSACLSADSRKLTLYRNDEAFVVDTQSGRFQWFDNRGWHTSVAFGGDSQRMAVGMANWRVFLYDVSAEAASLLRRSTDIGGGIPDVAFHPNGKLLALNVDGRLIRLYDPDNDRLVLGAYEPSLAQVRVLRFSPDGSLLAIAGARPGGGYGVELLDVDLHRGMYRAASILPCEHEIWCMVFSPDNRTLVTGGLGTTRLWHLPPAPTSQEEVQSRTWGTLGFRLDEQGNPVFPAPPTNDAENIRARLTQAPATSVTPLDAALSLPPSEALTALQALAAQHPGATVYRELRGRLHSDLMVTNGKRGEWKEALAHANEAIRLGYDDPLTQAFRALLFAQVGDIDGYRASCTAMAQGYKSCNDPGAIRLLAEAVSILPGVLDDYDELIEHVRRSVRLVGGGEGPAYRFYLGAVLAAAGKYEFAATELEQVDQYLEEHGAPSVFLDPIELKFLLATCHAHLGHKDIARRWFDAAVAETKSVFGPDQRTVHVQWYLRPLIALRQQDAESALRAPAP